MLYKTVKIKKNELAVVYKEQEFNGVLKAGKHKLFDPLNKLDVKIVDLANTRIDTSLAEYLYTFCDAVVADNCLVAELADNEIGLRYEDQKLVEVLLPKTRTLFWKGYVAQAIETVTLEQGYKIPADVALKLFQEITAKNKVIGLDKLTVAHITQEQVGVLFIDRQVKQIIGSDKVVAYCSYQHEAVLTLFDVRESTVHEKLAEAMEQAVPNEVAEYCLAMETRANEAGLRYEDDLLVEILPPGTKRLYWQNMRKQSMVKVDLNEGYVVPEPIIQQLLQPKLRQKSVVGDNAVLIAQIPAYHVGVLKVDSKVQDLLDAGITAYWRFNREVSVEIVDTRLQTLDVAGQEILTKDKVNLRVNLVANWCYNDVLTAYEKVSSPVELLYRELQLGLREAVGTRTLDELLENKTVIDEVVSEHIARKLTGYGIETASLGVKDIVLPGEMKEILAQVVAAEKAAQANVIRRREETSATRSLLNTAKVMENNPVALRLKEMETLERIAERIDKISVVGGLDQVLHGLVNIKNSVA